MLESNRISLIHCGSLSPSQQEELIDIFLCDYKFPVHIQNWYPSDINYLLNNEDYFWGINSKSNDGIIGYVTISDIDHFFEICIQRELNGWGYSVDAAILAIDYFFRQNNDVSVLYTKIFHQNKISIKSAINFGWKYMYKYQHWLNYEYKKDDFYNSARLNKIKRYLNINF